MRGSRRNDLGDLRSVRIAEINKYAQSDHGQEYPSVGQNIFRNDFIRDVGGECQQPTSVPGPEVIGNVNG